MKITVADTAGDQLFSERDFTEPFPSAEIQLLALPPEELLDGSIFRALPLDTTHLITTLVDKLGQAELEVLRDLRYVGLAFSGWWDKYFDAAAIKAKEIVVTNNSDYAPNAVTEAVFACLLSEFRLLNCLELGNPHQRSPLGREVRGRTFGIIGLGKIGSAVASTATGLGMKVISSSNECTNPVLEKNSLFSLSDVIGVFVPKSAGIVIRYEDLAMMKSDAVIINPSGHENIDIEALETYLAANPTARYIYLAKPTYSYFERLRSLPNARLWPLFSGNTIEARQRRREGTLLNLRRYVENGEILNRVI